MTGGGDEPSAQSDTSRLGLLYVGGDEDTVDRLRGYVEDTAPDVSLFVVADSETAVDRMQTATIDCVIVDGNLAWGPWNRIARTAETPIVLRADRDAVPTTRIAAVDAFISQDPTDPDAQSLIGRAVQIATSTLDRETGARPRTDVSAVRDTDVVHRTLVERSGDPIVVFDSGWRISYCNPSMGELFGRERAALNGRSLSSLLPAEAADTVREAAATLRAGAQEQTTCTLEFGDHESVERVFEATITAAARVDDTTADGDGGIQASVDREPDNAAGIALTLHDVTQYRRRTDELSLLKQVLTRVLRHDVRSGLTVIRGQAEVLRDGVDGDALDLVDTIIDRSEEMVETTEKARAIERVLESDVGRTTIDLRTAVNRSIANVSAAYPGGDYDVQIPSQYPVVVHHALPYALEDVIENAIAHNDADTPSVTATVSHTTEDELTLEVRDNGPGIPRDELDVLERGKETPLKHGTGLGLWLVNWVVERSGGSLAFDIEGSTTVSLRLERGEQAALVDHHDIVGQSMPTIADRSERTQADGGHGDPQADAPSRNEPDTEG